MPVRKAIVTAAIGLHARPAAVFVRAVTATGLPVTISKDGKPGVDARSLLEVMTEDFDCGCEVELAVAADALPARYSLAEAENALEPTLWVRCWSLAQPPSASGAERQPVTRPGRARRARSRPAEARTNDGGPHRMVGPAVVALYAF